ncbi:hypothetical protein M0Q97_09385 [Candidatus Dojkabacteria bacterium]|jgi:hypothetical protein|nr:hypothetical protein [Candidatus Dojkabacteria bacterium]
MNKVKYLHTKRKNSKKDYKYKFKEKHKPTCIEDYENITIPRGYNFMWWKRHYTWLDFHTICDKYLLTKIDKSWDDIYADMIKKTKPKFRYLLDDYLDYKFFNSFIIVKAIPQYIRYTIINKPFLYDGTLKLLKTKQELEIFTKNVKREQKLNRILESDVTDLDKSIVAVNIVSQIDKWNKKYEQRRNKQMVLEQV